MATKTPLTDIHPGFSSAGSAPVDWAEGRQQIDDAQIFWLSTVRPDGRPHVTPLLAVWHNDAMYFCTGPDERKAKNLQQNPHCILTTGHNGLGSGVDIVVEGQATVVSERSELAGVAGAYESKYGAHLTAPDGTWFGLGDAIRRGEALVYRVSPTTVLGFARGEEFSQTRWRFS